MDANSPTAPRKTTATERRQQALDYRIAGLTFQQIGDKLGITKQAAHALIVAALDDINKKTAIDAEKLREMELERLDSLWRTVYPQAKSGNLGATDRALKIMERRARLLGLDAPVKNDLTTNGKDITDYRDAIIRKLYPEQTED